MAGAVLQVRMDSELKRKATRVYESLGLDLSSAVQMFFTRSVQVGGIPFPTSSPKNVSYDYEAAMENIMEARRQSVKNGTSDITLDEINAIIADYRGTMGGKETQDSYLVTGNKKHFPIHEFVVSPSEFLEIAEKNK